MSLDDVHRLLGLQPLYNGSFTPLLTLKSLTESQQQELTQIQNEYRNYWAASKVSEGQVRLLSLGPLLRLAGYNRPPIRLDVEEEIEKFYRSLAKVQKVPPPPFLRGDQGGIGGFRGIKPHLRKRSYIENEDTYITGHFDIVAVRKDQPTANPVPLWS